jgi:hypothetical protein
VQRLARRPRVDAQPAQLFPPQKSFQMGQRGKGARARGKLTQGARVGQQEMRVYITQPFTCTIACAGAGKARDALAKARYVRSIFIA